MGAEDPAVGVALVDDDVAQGPQEGGPARVGREDPAVQHVGVGQDVVRVLPHPLAFLDGCVPVVDRGAHGVAQRGGQFPYGAPLVGRQGLGGGQVQGGRAPAVRGLGSVGEGGEHGCEVGQGLAGGGAGGHDHGRSVEGELGRRGLVFPRMVDSGRSDRGYDVCSDAVRPDCMTTRPRGQVLRMGDARSTGRPP